MSALYSMVVQNNAICIKTCFKPLCLQATEKKAVKEEEEEDEKAVEVGIESRKDCPRNEGIIIVSENKI